MSGLRPSKVTQRLARVRLRRMVQPHPVEYKSWDVTERAHATQLRIGHEVLGLYWHLRPGFHRTGGKKIYTNERDAKLSVVRSEIKKLEAKLASLKAEALRLNDQAEI